MEQILLQATKRDVLGKKCKALRRQGITPVHVYGHGVPSLALQARTGELKHALARAGKTKLIGLVVDGADSPTMVLTREIQMRHRNLIHVDFYQVNLAEKTTVEVPVELIGEAPAAKGKDRIVVQNLTHITVECLPMDIPEKIEVDISVLAELEQAIHVRDLSISDKITVLTDPDEMIVKVSMAEEEKEEVVKPAAEVEVVGEEEEKEEAKEEEREEEEEEEGEEKGKGKDK